MGKTYRLKMHAKALVWAVIGLVVVYGGVVAMNELARPPEKEKRLTGTTMEVQKTPEKPPEKTVKKKPEPKPRTSRHNPPPAPLAGLGGSELSGVNFNIPELNTGGFSKPGENLLGSTEEVTMTGDTVDVPPRPARQEAMEYPSKAKKKGIEGYVVLSLLIRENGVVDRVKVLEAQPSGVFEEAAKTGVRKWIFQPARYKGKNVKVWAKQKIRFELG